MGLLDKRDNYRPFEYDWAFEFSKKQNEHHWTHSEIGVDTDLAQYSLDFTDAEKHGIVTVLKLFTTYEVKVADYWIDVVYKRFPKPEIRGMAQVFSGMEYEHAAFYDKLNNKLGLSTKDFYLDFLNNDNMKSRIDFIGNSLAKGTEGSHQDLAESLATFSFIEGVILYSSFAFLMSFQRPPKNKLMNVCTGLKYSTVDENLHAIADSKLFNVFVDEYKEHIDLDRLESTIMKVAEDSFAIESAIIDEIFSQGKIEGITSKQLKKFVQSRINLKLKDIGYKPMYEVGYNPIAKWFYKLVGGVTLADFFARKVTEYRNVFDTSKIKEW